MTTQTPLAVRLRRLRGRSLNRRPDLGRLVHKLTLGVKSKTLFHRHARCSPPTDRRVTVQKGDYPAKARAEKFSPCWRPTPARFYSITKGPLGRFFHTNCFGILLQAAIVRRRFFTLRGNAWFIPEICDSAVVLPVPLPPIIHRNSPG